MTEIKIKTEDGLVFSSFSLFWDHMLNQADPVSFSLLMDDEELITDVGLKRALNNKAFFYEGEVILYNLGHLSSHQVAEIIFNRIQDEIPPKKKSNQDLLFVVEKFLNE